MLLWIEHIWLAIRNVVTLSTYLTLHFIAPLGTGDFEPPKDLGKASEMQGQQRCLPSLVGGSGL